MLDGYVRKACIATMAWLVLASAQHADTQTLPQVSTSRLQAQANQSAGAISIAVKDANGAVIVDAWVTITSEASGFWTKTQTDQHGFARITGLAPGYYVATVEMRGFKTLLLRNISLIRGGSVKDEARLDVSPIVNNWPVPELPFEPSLNTEWNDALLPLARVPDAREVPRRSPITRLLTSIRNKF